MKKIIALTIFILACNSSFSQISTRWESYYDTNPTGIRTNFSANDFIKTAEFVNFNPQGLFRDKKTLQQVLLRLSYNDLRQMSIDGWYHSKTIKHDDYFKLYNLNYNKISKSTWNKYCTYLIPIMAIDLNLELG